MESKEKIERLYNSYSFRKLQNKNISNLKKKKPKKKYEKNYISNGKDY